MILRRGVILATLGGVLGLIAAAGATRFLETTLFEVKALDVQVYLGVAVLLGVVSLLASYFPARRAAALDPLRVLKTD